MNTIMIDKPFSDDEFKSSIDTLEEAKVTSLNSDKIEKLESVIYEKNIDESYLDEIVDLNLISDDFQPYQNPYSPEPRLLTEEDLRNDLELSVSAFTKLFSSYQRKFIDSQCREENSERYNGINGSCLSDSHIWDTARYGYSSIGYSTKLRDFINSDLGIQALSGSGIKLHGIALSDADGFTFVFRKKKSNLLVYVDVSIDLYFAKVNTIHVFKKSKSAKAFELNSNQDEKFTYSGELFLKNHSSGLRFGLPLVGLEAKCNTYELISLLISIFNGSIKISKSTEIDLMEHIDIETDTELLNSASEFRKNNPELMGKLKGKVDPSIES